MKPLTIVLKLIGIFIGTPIVLLILWVCYEKFLNAPPSDELLVKNFHENQVAFERLRDLLQSDVAIGRVATWGVTNAKNPFETVPPEELFPLARYNEYLGLLKQIGATEAFRDEGQHSDYCISVWKKGFAGDVQHISVCWVDQGHIYPAENSSEDETNRLHIDGNWYAFRY